MGMKDLAGGMALAGKVGVGAVGSALLTDTFLGAVPADKLSPVNRDLATAAVGLILTGGLLAVGVPAPYAAGPFVGNTAGAAVSAGRRMGWSASVANAWRQNGGSAGLRR